MDVSERSKSITRLLQHSILQLCNEHVGYSHKLQILGVLCMTVDDEQQELVVKVNNTLKRVSPPLISGKDGPQVLQPAAAPITPLPSYTASLPLDSQQTQGLQFDSSSRGENARTASPNQPLPQNQAAAHVSPTNLSTASTPSRKSHGRKRTNPVKVQHVYDEGELLSSEEEPDVLTVYPTDPESSSDVMPPSAPAEVSSPRSALSPRTREAHGCSRANPMPTEPCEPGSGNESSAAAHSSSISAVKALLLGRAVQNYTNSTSSTVPQDLSTHRDSESLKASPPPPALGPPEGSPEPRGLMLPLVLPSQRCSPEPSQDKPLDMSEPEPCNNHSDALEQGPPSLSANTEPAEVKPSTTNTTETSSPSAFHQDPAVKEELKVDCNMFAGYNNNNNNNNHNHPRNRSRAHKRRKRNSHKSPYGLGAEDFSYVARYAQTNGVSSCSSAISQLLSRTSEGLPTQVPYTMAYNASSPSKHNHQDGLTIQYTNTGPITVGKNGKNVSRQPKGAKVKDIILYDDSSPLNEQRGSRIETDYMLDSFGLEGRKRRRRNQDEALTAEEVAEYLGSMDLTNQVFTCKYCTEELPDLTQYLQHTLSLHCCYICHQCGKSFTTKSSLLRHRPIHTGMRRFACNICKKRFYRKDKCKAHIKRHLGEGGDNPDAKHCEPALE